MTSPIASIGAITPFVPFAAALPGPAAGAAGSAATGTATVNTAHTAANRSTAAFDAALSTALGGNPLASLVSSGMVPPSATPGATGPAPQVTAPSGVNPAAGAPAQGSVINTSEKGGMNLASSLANGFDAVQAAQHEADTLAVQAATGQLIDPAQLTIATTKAQLMTQVAAAIQSKAVTAFNTIMSMQA